MAQPRTPEHEDERLDGKADRGADKLPTYQELLDKAVDDTFPASDPISPSAAMQADRAISTAVDANDWQLKPDGEPASPLKQVVAEFDDEAAAHRALDEAIHSDLPTARLDVAAPDHADQAAATLTVSAEGDDQVRKALEIVRSAGGHAVSPGASAAR